MEPSVQPEYPSAEMLDRYLAGRATSDEALIVRVYLSRYPDAEHLLKQLPVLSLDPSGDHVPDTDLWWNSFVSRVAPAAELPIAFKNVSSATFKQQPKFGRLLASMRSWAAVGIITIAVIAVFEIGGIKLPIFATAFAPSQQLFSQTIITKSSQHFSHQLPDGSLVLLAPNTTLQYTSDGSRKVRDVILNGEAMFTVVPDEASPFVVRIGNAAVRVLGTSFTVRRYDGEATTKVIVAQGKVAVADEVLIGGDAVRIDHSGAMQIERGVDIGTAMAWTNGRLVFSETPLVDVIQELERWYDVKVTVVDSSIYARTITATFLVDAPQEAFDGLGVLLHSKVVRRGNHIIFASSEQEK